MKTVFTTNTERGKPLPRHLKEYGSGVNYHEYRKREAVATASQGVWERGIFILGLTNSGVRHVYKESMGIRERGYERERGYDREEDKVRYTYGDKWGVQS
jgi:hypothetical protein